MKASERYRRYQERDEEEKREARLTPPFGGSYLATGVFLAIIFPLGFLLRSRDLELNATWIAWGVGGVALTLFVTWLFKCLQP